MKNTHIIEFKCINEEKECHYPLSFSLLDVEKNKKVYCQHCNKEYIFNEELIKSFNQLVQLILAVRQARDILGHTYVAIDVPGHVLKIPYRLLLTRLNTLFSFHIGTQQIFFTIRIEPLEDAQETQKN